MTDKAWPIQAARDIFVWMVYPVNPSKQVLKILGALPLCKLNVRKG